MCDRSIIGQRVFRRTVARGFTLIELLVVMGIMAIIVAIAIPVVAGLQGAYSLDSVGQVIAGQLTLARQTAVASNHPVQVRFYKLADYNSSTTVAGSYHDNTGVYRAMQCFQEGDVTTTTAAATAPPVTPITRPYFFPAPVIIVSPGGTATPNANVYSLLTNTALTTSTTGDALNPLPIYGTTYGYSYFHFRANDRTDLSTSTANTGQITLVLENAKAVTTGVGAGLPKNFVTLQLNFTTGSVVYYRP